MRLSGHIGHVGLDMEIEETGIPEFRVVHLQRYLHLEGSVVGRNGLVVGNLLHIIVAAPPPNGLAPCNGIFHLCILHRNTGIAQCLTLDGHHVASLIHFVHLVESHLIRGTLVFLHANARIGAIPVDAQTEHARQSLCRQREVGRCRAIAVGGQVFLGHLFIISIKEHQLQPGVGHGLRVGALLVHETHHRGMHLLSRAVYLAVGIDVHNPVFRRRLTIIVRAPSGADHRHGLVGIGISPVRCEALLFAPFHHAVGIGLLLHRVVVLLRMAPHKFHVGTAHGFSRQGIHHDVARPVVGQVFRKHLQVAHPVVERVGLDGFLAGGELHLVMSQRQARNHQRILAYVVGLHVVVATRHGLHGLLGLGIKDAHRQEADVADIAHLHLTTVGQRAERALHICHILRTGEVLLHLPEIVGIGIGGPCSQRIVGILHLLLGRVIAHFAEFLLGQPSAFGQVLVGAYERVKVVLHMVGRQHRCQPVALLFVELMHDAVGLAVAVLGGMIANHR